MHLRLGNFAAIPKLLEPITQSEDNLLAPDCLNLVAVAHAMQVPAPVLTTTSISYKDSLTPTTRMSWIPVWMRSE